MKYLGIDYGKKKVGLAISEGEITSPYQVIKVAGLNDAVTRISAVIEKEEIGLVVIGMPDSGQARNITDQFINELRNVTPQGCDIVEAEETLSSKNALQSMIKLGVSRKKRELEDAYAACLILQEFLDK